jgi:hypothetical protein
LTANVELIDGREILKREVVDVLPCRSKGVKYRGS